MKKAQRIIFSFVTISLIVFIAGPARADWAPGDSHKMHFPQLPDPDGWDIDMTQFILADDWKCTETGPVSDIHFWYSNAFETSPLPLPHFAAVNVSIHADVPVGANTNPDFSHPGELLWSRTLTGKVAGPWQGVQGWDDPTLDLNYRVPDHFWYWQLNITDIAEPFIQQAGTIYWLDLQVVSAFGEGVGWKTTLNPFNDVAVYKTAAGGWAPIAVGEPQLPTDLAFVITPEPVTLCLLLAGGLAVIRRRR